MDKDGIPRKSRETVNQYGNEIKRHTILAVIVKNERSSGYK